MYMQSVPKKYNFWIIAGSKNVLQLLKTMLKDVDSLEQSYSKQKIMRAIDILLS